MDPLDHIITQEHRDILTGAIRSLPERERLVLRMCDIEGFDAKETGGCLNMPPSKVRQALERARAMLKARVAG